MEVREGRLMLTREELYEQVWTIPMRKLAPSYGLSDVGLKKVCTKHKIPTPPPGYWAKKEYGKTVKQPPLPPLAEPTFRTICLNHDPDARSRPTRPSSYPVTDPDLVRLYLYERDPKHRIKVPDHLRNPHPVIETTRRALAGDRKPDRFGHTCPDYQVASGCAAISVASHSIPRALLLMNCMFCELEKRGHPVIVRPPKPSYSPDRNRVKCQMLGEEFGFGLREKTRMVRLTEDEQRRQLFSELVRYEPSGHFELRVTGEHGYALCTRSDGLVRTIEDNLNAIVIDMLVAVERARSRREVQKQEETARLQREHERSKQERLKQVERARVEEFEALAIRSQRAEVLRAYAESVRQEATRRFGQIDHESGLARWLEWAASHLRAVDPLLAPELPSIEEDGL